MQVVNGTVQPGEPADQYLGLEVDDNGNPINTEQQYLQNKAPTTDTGTTLWEHFPIGTSDPLAPDPVPNKHPRDTFLDNFGLS